VLWAKISNVGILRFWVPATVAFATGSGAACNALTRVGSLKESPCVPDCGAEADTVDAGDATVNAGDATVNEDGATPALDATGDAPADAAPGWCAAQDASYRLCSDFDLPDGPVTQGFDLGVVPVPYGEGGTFQLDPKSFVSPPHGGLGVANPFPAQQTSGVRLEGTLWALGPSPSTVQCTLQWNPHKVSTVSGDYAHVAALGVYSDAQQNDQEANFSVQMHADGSLIFLEIHTTDTPMDVPHAIPIQVSLDAWYAVEMSFTTSAGVTTYSVSVGGVPAAGNTLVLPLPTPSHGAVAVGPAYYAGATTEPSPGWTFGYDNVICF
jgi:hypothetical protein